MSANKIIETETLAPFIARNGTLYFRRQSYVARQCSDGEFRWKLNGQIGLMDKKQARKSGIPTGGIHNGVCTRLVLRKIDDVYSNDNH